MFLKALLMTAMAFFFARVACALPVQYALTPSTGLMLLDSCDDGAGHHVSHVHLRFSSSRLEAAKTVGLEIKAALCIRFVGLVERASTFRSFPVVTVFSTRPGQPKTVALEPEDMITLQNQLGVRLKPLMHIERGESENGRRIYSVELLGLDSKTVARISLGLSDEEARTLPGYDYQTQLPIITLDAEYDGMSLYATTRATKTVGLARKPNPARTFVHTCTAWEKFVSFFEGANPNCK